MGQQLCGAVWVGEGGREDSSEKVFTVKGGYTDKSERDLRACQWSERLSGFSGSGPHPRPRWAWLRSGCWSALPGSSYLRSSSSSHPRRTFCSWLLERGSERISAVLRGSARLWSSAAGAEGGGYVPDPDFYTKGLMELLLPTTSLVHTQTPPRTSARGSEAHPFISIFLHFIS